MEDLQITKYEMFHDSGVSKLFINNSRLTYGPYKTISNFSRHPLLYVY